MEQEGKKTGGGTRGRYVWDPQKLAWVETTESLPVEKAEKPPEAEVSVVEEEVLEESAAVEAEAEVEEVEAEYKGALSRLGGALIDLVIISIIAFIIRLTIARVVGLPAEIVIVYGLLYFVGFWTWRGQTPGKMLIGAKIVRTDGSPVGFIRALLRYIFYLFPLFTPIMFFGANNIAALLIILPLVALFIIGFNRQKRGLHDFIAGTCVINTRIGDTSLSVEDNSGIEETSDTEETEEVRES